MILNVVLLAFLAPACSQPVEITSVGPSAGSLAGGTRMHIRGSGFSNNMGGLHIHPSLCLPASVSVSRLLTPHARLAEALAHCTTLLVRNARSRAHVGASTGAIAFAPHARHPPPLTFTGEQKVVIGGKYECHVIPLHSTVSQIACKTSSAAGAVWNEDGEGAGTGPLDVVVIVDKVRVSTCLSKDSHGCKFQFKNGGWWSVHNTPKVSILD